MNWIFCLFFVIYFRQPSKQEALQRRSNFFSEAPEPVRLSAIDVLDPTSQSTTQNPQANKQSNNGTTETQINRSETSCNSRDQSETRHADDVTISEDKSLQPSNQHNRTVIGGWGKAY